MSHSNNSLSELRGHTCITTADGHPISLTSTVFGPEDIEQATIPETHGIGLFDNNFLFKNRTELPGEEEQFEIYKKAVSRAGDRPVTIRICNLHAGQLPGVKIPFTEKNPDLGLKGLRLGLQYPEILKTQFRAIARANFFGHIHLLLPMVSTPLEIKQVKKILSDIYTDLEAVGTDYRPVTELGVMVDLPSAVVNAALLSFDAAFFQVGDALRNYTMGVDFTHGVLPHLKHEFEPAYLLQIQSLTETVTKRNKTVSVSAPIASIPEAIPIFLALGIQDFVMHPKDMGPVKKIIKNITIHKAKIIGSKAMSFRSGEEIQKYAKDSLDRYLNT